MKLTKKYTTKELQEMLAERGITGIKPGTVISRINRSRMSLEEALTTPVMSLKEAGRAGGKASSWQRGYK